MKIKSETQAVTREMKYDPREKAVAREIIVTPKRAGPTIVGVTEETKYLSSVLLRNQGCLISCISLFISRGCSSIIALPSHPFLSSSPVSQLDTDKFPHSSPSSPFPIKSSLHFCFSSSISIPPLPSLPCSLFISVLILDGSSPSLPLSSPLPPLPLHSPLLPSISLHFHPLPSAATTTHGQQTTVDSILVQVEIAQHWRQPKLL